jgi:hypothetical protein
MTELDLLRMWGKLTLQAYDLLPFHWNQSQNAEKVVLKPVVVERQNPEC